MKKNITINCVSPGFIQSSMTDRIVESIKGIKLNEILVAEDPLLNSYSSDGFSETVEQVIKNEFILMRSAF